MFTVKSGKRQPLTEAITENKRGDDFGGSSSVTRMSATRGIPLLSAIKNPSTKAVIVDNQPITGRALAIMLIFQGRMNHIVLQIGAHQCVLNYDDNQCLYDLEDQITVVFTAGNDL